MRQGAVDPADQRGQFALAADEVAARPPAGLCDRLGQVELRVLPKDRVVERTQLRSRLDPDLLDEGAARLAVGLQRVGLAARPVERDHPLGVELLAQRLLGDQRLELGDHLAVAPGREVIVDRELDRVEPSLLQAACLGHREGLDHVGQRRAPPERQRLTGGAAGQQPLEAQRIAVVAPEAQLVAVPARDDRTVATGRGKRLAQLRDVDLQHLRRGRRRLLAPDTVDEPVGRHRLAGVEREQGEERARLAGAEGDLSPPDAGLHGSQDTDVQPPATVLRRAGGDQPRRPSAYTADPTVDIPAGASVRGTETHAYRRRSTCRRPAVTAVRSAASPWP